MAGTFILGEQKVRPGSYFNIQTKDSKAISIMNGVTAVIFKADFGPLNTVVELDAKEGYETVFGTSLTTDAIREAIAGGAKTIIACRLGNGGTKGTISLKDADGEGALTIIAKHAGDKEFTVTIREKLSDSSLKQCIFYVGTTEFEKVEFKTGAGEAAALVAALVSSKNFSAEVIEGKEAAILPNISQSEFTKGSNPVVTAEDYSNAFAEVEAYEFNTICVDTEDPEIHLLLQSFINRIFDAGSLVHQTAARIAGLIGSVVSNSSLTHMVITGFTEILERLTNTEMIAAEKKGCIVFSYNNTKQVWIDNAINTLIVPAENQDEGWKKIRRVKTRYELIRRINITTDALIGKVDNDTNGRSTVIIQIQGVGDAMVAESKLVACKVTESTIYTADGDSAWFDIDVVDKDSMEHIYLTFLFQFSTNG